MTIARKALVDQDQPGAYHVISRCVRRAFLCGDGSEHRKAWIQQRLKFLGKAFAVDVMAYAVMSNHLHLVLRNRPDVAAGWQADEVAQRWAACYPRRDEAGDPLPPDPQVLATWAANPLWVATHRERLASLSWFNKLIKEPLARMANREDRCTGAFWEGRFKSVPLLDEGAVIACMAYVDLNPIRAKLAQSPEDSAFTSIIERIFARQAHRQARALRAAGQDLPPELRPAPANPEERCWLTPLLGCTPRPQLAGDPCIPNTITLDEYLELVDATGRCIAIGKRGHIPAHLAPILQRLDLSVERWLASVCGIGFVLGTAIGSAAARAKEALRRGGHWIIDKLKLHHSPGPAPNTSS